MQLPPFGLRRSKWSRSTARARRRARGRIFGRLLPLREFSCARTPDAPPPCLDVTLWRQARRRRTAKHGPSARKLPADPAQFFPRQRPRPSYSPGKATPRAPPHFTYTRRPETNLPQGSHASPPATCSTAMYSMTSHQTGHPRPSSFERARGSRNKKENRRGGGEPYPPTSCHGSRDELWNLSCEGCSRETTWAPQAPPTGPRRGGGAAPARLGQGGPVFGTWFRARPRNGSRPVPKVGRTWHPPATLMPHIEERVAGPQTNDLHDELPCAPT